MQTVQRNSRVARIGHHLPLSLRIFVSPLSSRQRLRGYSPAPPVPVPQAAGSQPLPIYGGGYGSSRAAGLDLNSSLESTATILGAEDDVPAGSYHHGSTHGSTQHGSGLLAASLQPQYPSMRAAQPGMQGRFATGGSYGDSAFFDASCMPQPPRCPGSSYLPQASPLFRPQQQEQPQQRPLVDLDSILDMHASGSLSVIPDELDADPSVVHPLHFPQRQAPLAQQQWPASGAANGRQYQVCNAGPQECFQEQQEGQYGGCYSLPQQQAQQLFVEEWALQQQHAAVVPAGAQQQPLQVQQQHYSSGHRATACHQLGMPYQQGHGQSSPQRSSFYVVEEGDMVSEGGENSDATMHAAPSPGASPTSPNLSSYAADADTAAAVRPSQQGMLRRSGSVSRTSTGGGNGSNSAGSGGAVASRAAQARLRSVIKQQLLPRVRPSPAAMAAAAAAAAATGGSGRPRRAAALRSLTAGSYAGTLLYDEEGDESQQAQRDDDYEVYDDMLEGEEEELGSGLSAGRLPVGGPAGLAAAAAGAVVMPAPGKKKHNPWSQEETESLIEGVRLVGIGKWAEIKKLPVPAVAGMLANRSAVDLKDKWRNLSRVARLPKSALKSRLAKGGSDTPLELVLAVKELLDSGVHRECGGKDPVLITLGPACQDVEVLARMLEAGVTCARIDLTWGTKEYHRRSLRNLSEAMRRTRRLCSVWLDTMGREMVVRRKVEYDEGGWPAHGESLKAEKGQTITVTTDPAGEATATVYPINYPSFPSLVGRYLSTGSEGGSLYLEAKEVFDGKVICEATNSATLDGLLTVMICHRPEYSGVDSSADLELPLLTQNDVECIKAFSQEFEIDYVSLSYTNSARDVYECRALLDSIAMNQTKIVAKIERKAAIINFASIAEAADGVILSRGNLGLDFDPELMALLQKRTITRCNRMGKPIIITRVVDTMVNAPRCTRAEATDVANAVLDGADGLMLGAETLRGQYPLETVNTVLRIADSAEVYFDFRQHHDLLVAEQFDEPAMLARSSSGDLFSLDNLTFGPSPTARLMPPAHFPRPGDGGSNGHASYTALAAAGTGARSGSGTDGGSDTAAGAGAPEIQQGGFGSLVLPQEVAAAAAEAAQRDKGSGQRAGIAAVRKGPNGATFASSLATTKYTSSFGNLNLLAGVAGAAAAGTLARSESAEALKRARAGMAQVLKLESIASSAVRTAEKINAGLIVVMTQTGRTASLVAKYRPPMPVLAVVVPTLRSNGLGWRLEGKYLARQCLIIRGVVPMLAAPMSEGSDDLLSEAIYLATSQKLAKPNDYVVCIQSRKGALVFKVVQVNDAGTGMRMMSQGNSLISGEDPDIVSGASPFMEHRADLGTPRGFSRGLSFRQVWEPGAGTFGAGAAATGGNGLVLTQNDAQTVLREGSTHGGVMGGLTSQIPKPPADGPDSLDASFPRPANPRPGTPAGAAAAAVGGEGSGGSVLPPLQLPRGEQRR
ncbi:hypothetical protein N2152v2_008677 [Parachlorella kessleri]